MKLLSKQRGFDALPVLAGLAGVAVIVALGLVFGYAPTERSMGIVQKIFYFHVPSAIAAYLGFLIACIGSCWYLVTGDVRGDVIGRAGAEAGVLFCLIVLTSGPLWARKAWGSFWTGEPRLMLTLVLFLIFCAYLVVRSFGGRTELTRRIGAVLAILGVADIPLVRVAVQRWRGNHPQVLRGEGGGITDEMQVALMAGFVAVSLLFATLMWLRVRVGFAEEDLETTWRALQQREDRVEDAERLTLAGAPG